VNIPILMYHSISDSRDWGWGHLSCPVKVFEGHVHALAEAGFHTVSLQEIYAHARYDIALPSNPIALTFDDGYLDNWVFAYPILKRYGFSGTIFVNPEFVDPAPELRPNLDDLEVGRIDRTALRQTGFLSWAEMAAMESTGVMDIQSHALTHTWHFTDDTIVDFHHPGDDYPWLAWNARPERKHLWMDEDQSAFVPWGTPIYAHDKALVARRYLPDPGLADTLVKYVELHGGASFFQSANWQALLRGKVEQHWACASRQDGWETEADYEARVRSELREAKDIIESRLHKAVRFLCWPGGGYNAVTEATAREVGYKMMTLSSQDPRRAQVSGGYLVRVGAPTLPRRGRTLWRSGRYVVAMLSCRQGNILACLTCKALTGWDIAAFDLKWLIAKQDRSES
jgi:peptidoglycan/xylan/chitin deacetylase (PgdA/CDA1 family)